MQFSSYNDLGDRRIAQQKDETLQRQIRLRNMKREEKEARSDWHEKQIELLPKALVVSNIPTLQNVLIEENGLATRDENLNYDRALKNLTQLATKETAMYILDRLEREQIFTLNQMWNSVLERIRKAYTNSGLDKDVFISYIQSLQEPFDEIHESKEDPENISERGRERLANERGKMNALDLSIEAQTTAEQERHTAENERGLQVMANLEEQRRQEAINLENHRIQQGIELENERRRQVRNIFKTKIYSNIQRVNREQRRNARMQPIQDANMPADEPDFINRNLDEAMRREAETSAEETKDGGARNVLPNDRTPNTPETPNTQNRTPKRAITPGILERINQYKSAFAVSGSAAKPRGFETLFKNNLPVLQEMVTKQFGKEETFGTRRNANGYPERYSLPKKELVLLLLAGKQVEGFGLKSKKRVIVGCGMSLIERKPKAKTERKEINGKYIDLLKLKNNIVSLRYCSTGGYCPLFKVQTVNVDVKNCIEDIIENKFDKRFFDKLKPEERRLVKQFVRAVGLKNIETRDTDDEEYDRQFNILKGEFAAGNNSPEIKNKLKSYVVSAIAQNKITRAEGFNLLYQLSV